MEKRKFKRVVIIDDDDINNYICNELIKDFGFAEEVQTFTSARTALEFIATNGPLANACPELIFLDLNMPDMDGWDFLEAFRSHRMQLAQPIRIVILTSSGYHRDIQRAKSYPEVTAYLNKPLDDDALLRLSKVDHEPEEV